MFATVDAETFDRFTSQGGTTRWIVNDAGGGYFYVRCYQGGVAGELAVVARLLTGAGKREQVRYVNGDRLDLRASNLVLMRGPAKGQTRTRFDDNEAPPPVRDQPRPSGTMGTPEPTSGYAFAPL